MAESRYADYDDSDVLLQDKIVFIPSENTKIHVLDLKSKIVHGGDIQMQDPTAKFPKWANWTVLKNGNIFFTGGAFTHGDQKLKLAWEINMETLTVVKEHAEMLEGRS